jgi:hypothetical protein
VHRAGQRIRLAVPLEHPNPEATAGEQQRRRQPHGPGADHDHGDAGHTVSLADRCTTLQPAALVEQSGLTGRQRRQQSVTHGTVPMSTAPILCNR